MKGLSLFEELAGRGEDDDQVEVVVLHRRQGDGVDPSRLADTHDELDEHAAPVLAEQLKAVPPG
jgi:hypothetical protein